jgi:hypothetical protein
MSGGAEVVVAEAEASWMLRRDEPRNRWVVRVARLVRRIAGWVAARIPRRQVFLAGELRLKNPP